MFSHNSREECTTTSLSVKSFHASGSSRSCYSTFSVSVFNQQWLCHVKRSQFSDRCSHPGHHHHFPPRDRNWIVLARPPSPAMGGDSNSSTSMRELPEMCFVLDSTAREKHLPHHQLLFHHTRLKITNGSRLGKAQSCLRLDAQFPVPQKVQSSSSYQYCTQFCFREYFQLLFHSARMTHEGN